jgi:flagellar FliJ protein
MADRRRIERSKRLRKLVDIARDEERRVGQTVGQLQARLRASMDQLGELNAYRESYAAKSRLPSSGSAAHWHDYQSFLSKLDVALRTQQQAVRDAQRAAEVARQRWIEKRQRVETLSKVWNRSRSEEMNARERLEQKRLDDLVGPPAGPFDSDRDPDKSRY